MPPDGRREPAPFPLPTSSSLEVDASSSSRHCCAKGNLGWEGGEGTAKEEDWCSPSLRSETIVEGRGGGRRKGGVCTYAGCTNGAHRQKRRGNEEVGTFRHGECGKEGRIANPIRELHDIQLKLPGFLNIHSPMDRKSIEKVGGCEFLFRAFVLL